MVPGGRAVVFVTDPPTTYASESAGEGVGKIVPGSIRSRC